jgi:hypothetical protein
VYAVSYLRDNFGRITSKSESIAAVGSLGATTSTTCYGYDVLNRRVGKLTGSTFTQGFLYRDDLRPFAELGASGNVVRLYAYGTRQNSPNLVVEPGGKVYRIVTDQVGSPRLVVNVSSGKIVERTDYDEFGNVGRWTTKDPVFFGGHQLNLYTYVDGDPVNARDENGKELDSCDDACLLATTVLGSLAARQFVGPGPWEGLGGAVAGAFLGAYLCDGICHPPPPPPEDPPPDEGPPAPPPGPDSEFDPPPLFQNSTPPVACQ